MTFELLQIPSPNFTGGRPGPILGTLCHTTVATWESALATLTRPGGSNPVSAHFLVDLRRRRVAQLVDIGDQAWHSRSCNGQWIGVEHVDDGEYDDVDRTPEQYETSAELIAGNHAQLGIAVDAETVRRHLDCVNTACPDGLNVERIIAGGGRTMPTDAEWRQHLADEANTANAIKELLNPLAAWANGAPRLPKAIAKLERALDAQARGRTIRRAKRPTRAQVRAGHGR